MAHRGRMGCDNFIVHISYMKALFKTIKVKKEKLGEFKATVYRITSANDLLRISSDSMNTNETAFHFHLQKKRNLDSSATLCVISHSTRTPL